MEVVEKNVRMDTVALIDEKELATDPLDAMYLLMRILSENQETIYKCIKLKNDNDENNGC